MISPKDYPHLSVDHLPLMMLFFGQQSAGVMVTTLAKLNLESPPEMSRLLFLNHVKYDPHLSVERLPMMMLFLGEQSAGVMVTTLTW